MYPMHDFQTHTCHPNAGLYGFEKYVYEMFVDLILIANPGVLDVFQFNTH